MHDRPIGIVFIHTDIAAFGLSPVLTAVGVRAEIDLLINGGMNRNLLFKWNKFIWRLKVKESFVCEFLALHVWVG